ncbi:MAG: HAMP domain-containing histidine kinase [Propionibacteriaceae bacterium]|nr:HAMP domain-containing histidine kinase [Propionibacteriaceae bacterium]
MSDARLTKRQARSLSASENPGSKKKKKIHPSTDDEKVREAALSVGTAVAAATASIVLLGCLALIAIAATTAVPLEIPSDPSNPPPPKYGWLSANDVIWTVSIIALISLVFTPFVAWMMARRAVQPLGQALRLQRHFVADASHELRTPLTTLSSRVQILSRRLEAGKPLDEVIDQLQQDTINMANVLDDMLLTVEGENIGPEVKTSVGEALATAVKSLDALGEQSEVKIQLGDIDNVEVAVPPNSLNRAVVAIIDNAIQHSPAGSVVEVSSEIWDTSIVIRVRDHGPGISGVDPDRLFERFSHGRESGHKRSFGLGLALSSEVAQRFGGDLVVEETSDLGTTFALSFPVL